MTNTSLAEHLVYARRMNAGRCCGRKPIKYKRDGGPHYFCPRCGRAYSLETQQQITNWAYSDAGGGYFKLTFPHMLPIAREWK